MNPCPCLSFDVEGPDIRQRLEVGDRTVWVGRDPSCQVSLPSPNVSRRHVRLELTDQGLTIADRSSNGTVVNDQWLRHDSMLVTDQALTLQIGAFCVRVEELRGPSSKRLPRLPAEAPVGTTSKNPHFPTADCSPPHTPRAASPCEQSPTLTSNDQVPPALRRKIHRRLLEHLDLPKLDRNAMKAEGMRPEVEAALRRIVAALGVSALVDAEGLIGEIRDEVLGLGPLEHLLKDPNVSEIMVVDPQTIFVESSGKIVLTPLRFTDDDSVRAVIERIVTPLGRRIDESTPLVDARLPDGSRVNAVIPPLALRGPCITIRKFPKHPLGMQELIRLGSLTEGMAAFLDAAIKIRKNIVISGGTGSGKTTLLNVLSAAIPPEERVVTIEDAAELQLLQPHVVSLEARPPNLEGKGEYTIRDLVKNALRMRPDRIVVGECRGGEAVDMLQAMNTGHEGSLTTTHANSPREAIARIETLCLMAGLDLPIVAIRQQIAASIHLIVQQARFSDGSRRITNVSEVFGISDNGDVQLRELFSYQVQRGEAEELKGEFLASGQLPSFLDQMLARGLMEEGIAP